MAVKAKLKENGTTVITGEVRASYANVFEAKSINGGDSKYSMSIIIDAEDEDTLNAVKKAVENAKEAGKGQWGGKIPKTLKLPLRDADEEGKDDEAYEGKFFFNAASKNKPQIIDVMKKPIEDEEDFKSGDYCRVSVNFYAYNSNGSKGIAAGLNNIQKLRDGEALSGGSSAQEDFDEVDIEDADEL